MDILLGNTPPFLPGVPQLTEGASAAFRPSLAADKADSQREAPVADIPLTDMGDSSHLAEREEAGDLPR